MMDQFRIIVQIEQVDSLEGKVLCTYGPSPISVFVTENEDHAIDEFARLKAVLENHACKIVPLEETEVCPSCKEEVEGLGVNGICLGCEEGDDGGCDVWDLPEYEQPLSQSERKL